MLKKLIRDDKGQGMSEYALILALIAIGAILIMTTLGDGIRAKFTLISDTMTKAGNNGSGATPAP